MAVKSGKWLTAREIRGKKKHKILWCLRCLEGVFCGGQCPFSFGLYLGKERSDGIAIVARSADRVQCGVRSVISAAPKARKARGGHVPKQGEKKHLETRCFLAPETTPPKILSAGTPRGTRTPRKERSDGIASFRHLICTRKTCRAKTASGGSRKDCKKERNRFAVSFKWRLLRDSNPRHCG